MGKRGGIRQRLGLDEADQSAAASSSGGGGADLAARRSVRRRVLGVPKAAASASPDCDLPLVASLRRDWANGLLSAKQVQEYADVADRHGAMGVSAIAQAGSRGNNPQHVHRSLMAMFGKPKMRQN